MEYPEMIKEVKRWGTSYIIRFNPDDVKLMNLEVGDLIKIKIMEILHD